MLDLYFNFRACLYHVVELVWRRLIFPFVYGSIMSMIEKLWHRPNVREDDEYTDAQLQQVQDILDCGHDSLAILNLPGLGANMANAKKAYHACSFLVYPDKNKAPGATEAFARLQNAFAEFRRRAECAEHWQCPGSRPAQTATTATASASTSHPGSAAASACGPNAYASASTSSLPPHQNAGYPPPPPPQPPSPAGMPPGI